MAPILVYDDDCGFCSRSARFIARHGHVELVGFSALSPELRARLPEDYRECAHFVTEESVYSCGAAVERAFATTKLVPGGLVTVARSVPGYPTVRERVYRWVADNRGTIGRILP